MPVPFTPLPDDEPPLDTKQFHFRLEHDPGFAEKMRAHYDAALALPLNEDTAEIHKYAAAGLKTLKHHQGTSNALKLLLEASRTAADRSADPADVLAKMKILTAEATDHLLDVMEPQRTKLMGQIAEIREAIEKLQKR